VLSGAAKKLVTTFIVLGVLLAVAEGVLQASLTNNTITAAQASSQLQAAVDPLNSTLNSYSANIRSCTTNACVGAQNLRAAAAFTTFAAQVRSIPMPSGQASADAANLASASDHVASIYTALAGATTQSQYQSIASGLQPALAQVNSYYSTLTNELGSS
jgi:hypothetical protein